MSGTHQHPYHLVEPSPWPLVGSISGLIAEKGFLSYGTSKCAFMFASKIMAKEFERYNIRENAIAPSVFKSNMAKKMDKKIKK